jgi:cardiolipin synthase
MARLTSGIKAGRKAKIVAATFAATTLLVLLVANLALGDKRIDQQVPVLYSVEDAQFRRSMGVILGPQMIAGNRVEALVNG